MLDFCLDFWCDLFHRKQWNQNTMAIRPGKMLWEYSCRDCGRLWAEEARLPLGSYGRDL